MMNEWGGILIIFFIALLVSLIFAFGFRKKGPFGSFISFFTIEVLALWVLERWLMPVNEYEPGKTWAVYALAAIALGSLIAFFSGKKEEKQDPAEKKDEKEDEDELANPGLTPPAVLLFSQFFWMIIILMAIAIIVGYLK